MAKKYPFIKRKEARTFALVQRSFAAGGDAKSGAEQTLHDRVLVEVTRGPRSNAPHPLLEPFFAPSKEAVKRAAPPKATVDHDESENEYDYLQHMKPIGQASGAVYIANPHFVPHTREDIGAHPDVQEIMAALEDDAYVEEHLADEFFVAISGSSKAEASPVRNSASLSGACCADTERDSETGHAADAIGPAALLTNRSSRLIDAQFESLLLRYDDAGGSDSEEGQGSRDFEDERSDEDALSDAAIGEMMQEYIVADEAYSCKTRNQKERILHSIEEMDALRQALASVTILPAERDTVSEDSFDSEPEQWLRPTPSKRWDIQIAAQEIAESGPTYVPILIRETARNAKRSTMLGLRAERLTKRAETPSSGSSGDHGVACQAAKDALHARQNQGAARQKDETKQEKRLRKDRVKLEKQNRRQQKSLLAA